MAQKPALKNPSMVAGGIAAAMLGLLFTLQGIGLVKGSFMSDTVFWTVAGPIIAIAGLAAVYVGVRGRGR